MSKVVDSHKNFESVVNFIINDILNTTLLGINGTEEVCISKTIRTITYNERNTFKKIENQIFLDLYGPKILDV